MIFVQTTPEMYQVTQGNTHNVLLVGRHTIAVGSEPNPSAMIVTANAYVATLYPTSLSPVESTINSAGAGWVSDAIATIADLESYPRDWNGLDSDPPSPIATTLAKNLIDHCKALDFAPTRITASAEGGVALCFRLANRFASVECLNSGEIVALTSDGTGNPHAWEIGRDEDSMREAVVLIRGYFRLVAA